MQIGLRLVALAGFDATAAVEAIHELKTLNELSCIALPLHTSLCPSAARLAAIDLELERLAKRAEDPSEEHLSSSSVLAQAWAQTRAVATMSAAA